jgi:hypothetical protein
MVMVPVRIHLHATAVIEARAGRPPSAGDKADAEDHGAPKGNAARVFVSDPLCILHRALDGRRMIRIKLAIDEKDAHPATISHAR